MKELYSFAEKKITFLHGLRLLPTENPEGILEDVFRREYIGEVPGRKFERRNIISGLHMNQSVAPFEFKGTTNSEVFEWWFEKQLMPSIEAGSVIVLDNASFHRKSVLYCERETSLEIDQNFPFAAT